MQADQQASKSESPAPKKRYSLQWAQLLARVYAEDIQLCGKCGGKIKVTEAILEKDAITRILSSLGISSQIPQFHPPSRAPPAHDDIPQFDFGA